MYNKVVIMICKIVLGISVLLALPICIILSSILLPILFSQRSNEYDV